MRRFPVDRVMDIVKSMAAPVYLPVGAGGVTAYARYEDGADVRLNAIPTDKSPKDLLFPQWENLMRFRMEGQTISLDEEARCAEAYVLFGARACDLRAFQILDQVFLSEPVDTFYAARRAHGTTVAIACAEPADSCFCGVFGIDPAQPEADVVLWQVGDDYYVDAFTEKGEQLAAGWDTLPAGEAPVDKIKEEIQKKLQSKPFAKLNLAGFDGAHLKEKFDSPMWAKLALPCLGCGSCTFSCPTCQCYDIRDYDAGHGVSRYRCWDSCMYSDFTMMAHGTPRPTQTEKFRQRFMHKLIYSEANTGAHSCVGCGRCIKKCPMNLSIVKVIRALGEGDLE